MDAEQINKLREAAMEMGEMMDVIIEAVDGYRAKLEQSGYSPTMAEVMAGSFHEHLLTKIFGDG